MWYINFRDCNGVETIDEFDNAKEARKMLAEYNYGGGMYYLSKRCTKDWRMK